MGANDQQCSLCATRGLLALSRSPPARSAREYHPRLDWGIIIGWIISVVALIVIIYFAVYGAVLAALKAHTKWVDGGKHEPRQRLPYS